MRKRVLAASSGLLLFLLLSAVSFAQPLQIGVLQLVEHPALDAARQGFIDRLSELGYEAEFDIQSAQNEMSIAVTIAQKFKSDRKDLVLAIATPAAQAAVNVIDDIPILITAVTDPVAAQLVDSIERPGGNLTGTSDLTPVRTQLELLTQIVPNARRVGVLYNSGEVNSVVQVQIARDAARDLGLTLVEATAATTAEVLQAAQSLVGRVDAIYVPTDNTVVAAIESVVLVSEQARLPLIAGEDQSVENGALATIGIDYYQLGRQTADIAHRVLQGEDPAEISIEYQSEMTVVLNLGAARRIGLTIPEAVLAQAARIIED
ncbi:MAG: ABC transporter substrate-binding protein [Firmicutes bacterium]|jgi:putative ABC transport system substrate-binding protein|nr:ABC transporter substrate-binding protein [Bacillota bacterium]